MIPLQQRIIDLKSKAAKCELVASRTKDAEERIHNTGLANQFRAEIVLLRERTRAADDAF